MSSSVFQRVPRVVRRAASTGRRTLVDRGRRQPPSYVGVTRFSVLDPDVGAWKLSRNAPDLDSYRRRLWSAERMRPRCDIFLGLTVPILQQMAEQHDYRHIVRYSPELPAPWLTELLAAAERYPVLHLLDAGSPVEEAMTALVRARDRRSRTVVQFRLDDDDLLAVDFLDRLSAYATPHDHGRAVSMAVGYSALLDGGVLGPVHEVRRVFGAQGLAHIGHYDSGGQVLRLNARGAHYLVDRRRPTIVDSRKPAYFQMRHAGQDMVSDDPTTDPAELTRAISAELAMRPRVTDVRAVSQRFPTLQALLEA